MEVIEINTKKQLRTPRCEKSECPCDIKVRNLLIFLLLK